MWKIREIPWFPLTNNPLGLLLILKVWLYLQNSFNRMIIAIIIFLLHALCIGVGRIKGLGNIFTMRYKRWGEIRSEMTLSGSEITLSGCEITLSGSEITLCVSEMTLCVSEMTLLECRI